MAGKFSDNKRAGNTSSEPHSTVKGMAHSLSAPLPHIIFLFVSLEHHGLTGL